MPNFISTIDAAAELGVDKVTIAKWCRLGELEAVRIGRDWLVASPIVRRGLVAPVGRPRKEKPTAPAKRKRKKSVRA